MKKGFTLIELIVVIAIIAVLAAIIAPNAFKAIEKAKIARTVQDLKGIKTSVQGYFADTGAWPACHYINSTASPLISDPGVSGWDGPYLQKIAMSALSRQPATSGCGIFGYYYVWWNRASSGTYSCYFDFDEDGTPEVTDGISVCVYGLSGAQESIQLDTIFDRNGRIGEYGIMNVLYPSCGGMGLVALYIGRTGIPQ
jgi:type II secretion system protein G